MIRSFLLNINTVNNIFEALLAVAKLCDLIVIKLQLDLALNAVLTENVRKAHATIAYAVLAVHKCRNGHYRVKRGFEGADYIANSCGYCVEGRSLAGYDLCSRRTNVVLYLFLIEFAALIRIHVKGILKFGYVNVGYIRDRPRNKRRISVLAEDVCVYVLLAYIVILTESRLETRCIKDSSRAENILGGESRLLKEYVSKNVNGICHDYIFCLGCVFCYLGNGRLFTFACARSSLV